MEMELADDLRIINMEDVAAVEVDWLWYPYIPYGKITIVQGDPGEGKTTFALQLASILSKGETLPSVGEETSLASPINIIYQSAEDGLNDTIKPRLVEANADCTKIKVIDETKYPLSMADGRLEQAIQETGARLVVLDPIQAYLGGNIDMHRANEIRPVLKRLGEIADEYKCAVVLIGHMNKSKGAKSTYRGLGSIDFQAAARSVLIVGRIKDKPQIRVIAHGKSSLAPEGKSIAFELSEENGFAWLGQYDISVDDLLSGGTRENKLKMAEKLISEMLDNGDVEQKVVLDKAISLGISKRVLDQAKKNLSVKSKKKGNCWYWRLA